MVIPLLAQHSPSSSDQPARTGPRDARERGRVFYDVLRSVSDGFAVVRRMSELVSIVQGLLQRLEGIRERHTGGERGPGEAVGEAAALRG